MVKLKLNFWEENRDPAQTILEQELECFNHMLKETKIFLETNEDYSVDRILSLLHSRDYWIKVLLQLQIESQDAENGNDIQSIDRLKSEISTIAREIIGIDARVLDVLQIKKIQTIKEMSKMTDKYNVGKVEQVMQSKQSKIIDIRQE